MSMTTSKLRLGPLPKTKTVKVTIALTTALKADLERYAALHAQTYGEPIAAATLIPHMLEVFMAGDRGFQRLNNSPAHPIVKNDAGPRHNTPT